MKHKCSKCGNEDEVNPAAMLGGMRSERKAEASRRNGAKVAEMVARGRSVGGQRSEPAVTIKKATYAVVPEKKMERTDIERPFEVVKPLAEQREGRPNFLK